MPPPEGSHDDIGEHVDLPPAVDDVLHDLAPADHPEPERWPGQRVHEASPEDTQPGSYEQQVRNLSADEAKAKLEEHSARHEQLSVETRSAIGGLVKRAIRLERQAHQPDADPALAEAYRSVDSSYVEMMGTFDRFLEDKTDEEELQQAIIRLRSTLDAADGDTNPGQRKAA